MTPLTINFDSINNIFYLCYKDVNVRMKSLEARFPLPCCQGWVILIEWNIIGKKPMFALNGHNEDFGFIFMRLFKMFALNCYNEDFGFISMHVSSKCLLMFIVVSCEARLARPSFLMGQYICGSCLQQSLKLNAWK